MTEAREPGGVMRYVWLAAGWVSLALGAIGFFLPLLPTVPFVILAAFCFSKGSRKVEKWLLDHKHLGPIVRDWREHHAVPLGAKIFATVMMAISCTGAFLLFPAEYQRWAWVPSAICGPVAIWLWLLPTRK
jgi:uncharacterized membrane protein YbaN (DUF454 family)